ncbi:2'-5' RNA ligase [Domibacillus antri]|uniref:RNA 2',3'-cyclic phosphodiesterase n=1 Tax=Domibacillus antri TaxID=1714264 RepID=A0A1Q8Q5Y3_9BACI|nr:RNA 2',3'-cyclic phosphodiesterase [Domibacillus antri]OLN22711.1 2'-5' RNA ligase [Domibacillus antri]
MKPHYFFAVVIQDEIKQAIFQEMSRRHFPFKRFTHPDDYHITLSFLGGAEKEKLQKACSYIEKSLKDIQSFPLSLTSFQTFGPSLSPRIFWMGTDEPEELFHLQTKVADSCGEAGFVLDKKPFRPHITTARKWFGEKPYEAADEPERLSFHIQEIALYETNSLHEPRYTKKWSFLLNTRKEE